MAIHGWNASLRAGTKGELKFHELHPWLIRGSGRIEDFILPDGRMLELKTESRTTDETPNLACEWESSPGKPGAVERAVNDGIALITYMFGDGQCFTYKPLALFQYMRENFDKHRKVTIPNSTYKTTIILVPRDAVQHLQVELSENE